MLLNCLLRQRRDGVKTKPLVKSSCTLLGGFRTKLAALWESWKAGAAAARAGGEGSGGTRPTPWKQQVFVTLVEQLTEQGLEEKARKELAGVDSGDSVEAITHSEPPDEGEDRPWVLVLTFKPTWLGQTARFFLGSGEVSRATAKKDGQYQPAGLRAGRFVPGAFHRNVLEGLGYSGEEIKGWFKGGGRGSGTEGGKGGQGSGESRKRSAGQRLSVAEPRAAKK